MTEESRRPRARDDSDDEELEFLEHDPSVSADAPAADAARGPRRRGSDRRHVDPIEQAVELLSKINIFSGLQPTYLRRIVDIGLEERTTAKAPIFAEGTPGDKFYLIVEGAVRISRIVPGMGEEALAVLRPGNYFGEMSLIDDFAALRRRARATRTAACS